MARWILVVCLLLCQACTSEFIVKNMYNDIDEDIAESFSAYADFNAEQEAMIERIGAEFADWHRATQLPLYKDFLQDTRNMVSRPVSVDDLDRWSEDLVQHAKALTEKRWRLSEDLYPSLTAAQITQIADNLDEELAEEIEDYDKELRNGKLDERRSKETFRALRYALALKLNGEQKTEFRAEMQEIIDLLPTHFELVREWNTAFVDKLNAPRDAEWTEQLIQHLFLSSRLLRSYRPDEVEHNIAVLMQASQQLLNSLNDEQRKALLNRLQRYIELIDELRA